MKKHAEQLCCTQCRFPISDRSTGEPDGSQKISGAAGDASHLLMSAETFLRAELLPSTKPSGRTPPQSTVQAPAEMPKWRADLVAELHLHGDSEDDDEGDHDTPTGDFEEDGGESAMRELLDARLLVSVTKANAAELESRLAQLPGKGNRKERNELNKQIVALKNSPEVVAAQRLVRDPRAERQRRRQQLQARESEERLAADVKELVRCRLASELEEYSTDGKRRAATEETWSFLLRQGRAAGLAESDEVIAEIVKRLATLREEERLRQEQLAREEAERAKQREAEDAVKQYVCTLVRGAVHRAWERTRGGDRRPHRRAPAVKHPRDKKEERPWRRRVEHGGLWRRQISDPFPSDRDYKKKMCRDFEAGHCNRGSTCGFAHGANELRGRRAMPLWG